MTDINITFTECCLGAETIHNCRTISEAVHWAMSLLDGDRAVPVRIKWNDEILWDCAKNDEEDLNVLLQDMETYAIGLLSSSETIQHITIKGAI